MAVNPSDQRNFNVFKFECARLNSFFQPPRWSLSFIRPEDCARAGFFFLQDADKVQCAFCKGVLGEWKQGDDPMTEHRRHFACCPFVCGLQVGNIPISEESAGAASMESLGEAVMDNLGAVGKLTDGNESEIITSFAIKVCGNGPVHRALVTYSSRLNTFTNWPIPRRQTPDVLALAGFFYYGQLDCVRCFYCNGGLREWEALDDPWVEHARWFSNCTYVILIKGEEFVKKIHEINPPLVFERHDNQLRQRYEYTPNVFSFQGVIDQMGTPIVQAALEVGTDSQRVFRALLLKIQLTGESFLTTEALIVAVSGSNSDLDENSDSQSESISEFDPESDSEMDNVELDAEDVISIHPSGNTLHAHRSSSSSIMTFFNDVGTSSNTSQIVSHTSIQPPLQTRADEQSELPITSSLEVVEHAQDALTRQGNANCEKEQDVAEQILCKICMDSKIEILFLPCGHLLCCTRCATTLSVCALCRKHIKAFVRAYFS